VIRWLVEAAGISPEHRYLGSKSENGPPVVVEAAAELFGHNIAGVK
jgi:hypothetical protein